MEPSDTQGALDMSPEAIKARVDANWAALRARARVEAQAEAERQRLMTPEEHEREVTLRHLGYRKMAVGDQDLVAMALADPNSLDYLLTPALLEAPLLPGHETKFASMLPGYTLPPGSRAFYSYAKHPVAAPQVLNTPAACKFMICDMRLSPVLGEGDPVERVEAEYQEQLRMERENAPLERARELVRSPELKFARQSARAILRELEAAEEAGVPTTSQAIWDRIGPKHPTWVKDIAEGGEDYGFAILVTREAAARSHALGEWKHVFYETRRDDNLGGFQAMPDVYGEHGLLPRMNPIWIDTDEAEASGEQSPDDLRSCFRRTQLPNARYLRNTFLVLADECLFPELDTMTIFRDEEGDYDDLAAAPPPLDPEVIGWGDDLLTFFLWAYDVDWTPPAGGADDDGYEGRVKVGLLSLMSWFYYARLTGVYMKALWKRSLELKDQVWTCSEDKTRPGHPVKLI